MSYSDIVFGEIELTPEGAARLKRIMDPTDPLGKAIRPAMAARVREILPQYTVRTHVDLTPVVRYTQAGGINL